MLRRPSTGCSIILADADIPLPLLSQFMPAQYKAVRDGTLSLEPSSLVIDRIMEVTAVYSAACRGAGVTGKGHRSKKALVQ